MLRGQKALDVFWSAKFKDCISVPGSHPVLWEHTKRTCSCPLTDLYVVTAPMYLKLPLLSLSRSHNINNLNFSLWMLFSSNSHYFSLDCLQLIHVFLEPIFKTRHVFPTSGLTRDEQKEDAFPYLMGSLRVVHSCKSPLWVLFGFNKAVTPKICDRSCVGWKWNTLLWLFLSCWMWWKWGMCLLPPTPAPNFLCKGEMPKPQNEL